MLKAKNKFISEEKILSSLSEETKFLENKEISKNAQKIIELCRKNKEDRTKLLGRRRPTERKREYEE